MPRVSRLALLSAVVGAVLVLSGLFVGFSNIGGKFDSESFECGSPFVGATDDGGYGGTESYEGCEQERDHLRWIAGGNLILGVVLLGAVASAARTPTRESSA